MRRKIRSDNYPLPVKKEITTKPLETPVDPPIHTPIETFFSNKYNNLKAKANKVLKKLNGFRIDMPLIVEDDFDDIDTKKAKNVDRRGQFYEEVLTEYRRITRQNKPGKLDHMLETILDHDQHGLTPDKFERFRRQRRRK